MKFAIPLADGKLTTHFGHCKSFAFLTVEESSRKVLHQEEVDAPPHEPGLLPVWLHDRGITHVIAGGLGERAKDLLEQKNIRVVVGAPCLPPETLVQQFLSGDLKSGTNSCDH